MAKSGLGFPRSARLLRPEAYRRVFNDARRVTSPAFTVLVHRQTPPAEPRLGLAISRKCARRAVDRNRIKRIVRDSFRRHRGHLPPVDLVVMCRPQAARAERAELHRQLEQIWQRLAG
ncbi:MAG: ribonuclease P protein component [Gammaproteobacteria bacterium]|nr:MAG: ribonuclease P protein component [Gammaproteobacteria bacterium]